MNKATEWPSTLPTMPVVKVPLRSAAIAAADALPGRRRSRMRIDVSSLCNTGDWAA